MATEVQVRNAKIQIEEEAKAIYAENQQGQGAPMFDEMGRSIRPALITWEQALAQARANNPEAAAMSEETVDVLSTWEPIGDMTLAEQARELSKTSGFKADLAELRLNPKEWVKSLRSIDRITNPDNLAFYWDSDTMELVKLQLPNIGDDEIIKQRLKAQGLSDNDIQKMIDTKDDRYEAALEGSYVGDISQVKDPENPTTGKTITYRWDGNSWQLSSFEGKEINSDPLAVKTPQGVDAYTYDRLAPKIKEKEADLPTHPTGGGTELPAGVDHPPSPPTQGTGAYDPNLTRGTGGGPLYGDSWMNRGNIPPSQFTGTGRATQVGPWDPGGLFDPISVTSPEDYANLLKSANLQGISPTFREPFKDYLDKAQLTYGLMQPATASQLGARGGAGGFSRFITGQPQLANQEDLWGQVQGYMGGFSDLDPRIQGHLASEYGIGAEDIDARRRRGELATQLQGYDVNPLMRRSYMDVMARNYSRASLQNQMYRDNPLAWALEQRTGFVSPQLQQMGFGGALAGPQFDTAGNVITPAQSAQGTSDYYPNYWDIGGVG
jgi:hypothetical protein